MKQKRMLKMKSMIIELEKKVEKLENKLDKDEYTILMNIIEQIKDEIYELNAKASDYEDVINNIQDSVRDIQNYIDEKY